MARAGRGADQFMVRMPEGMREDIARSAEVTGRSMNAEIVARIEAYDALHLRIGELAEEKEKLTAQLDATKDALAEQRKITEQLRHLMQTQMEDAQRDEETENVIQKKFDELKAQTDYLESLKAELMDLSKERDELNADAAEVLKQQRVVIDSLTRSQKASADMLKSFQKVFKKAADGDDEELKKIVEAFQALDERDE